ncbi:hypothetical protein CNYM01_04885 [Colletotrichum nymphaeae SA-01]|uniref:Mg2+ transporter n=1 Tax=Colletotrichum nymphaeae SA-01 TaxID=1460502 RepID=A0A135TL68_9PEZI|nr:hypothetical protein CNYM01_04885 [Colletotrichum nymphaeae SA-01]
MSSAESERSAPALDKIVEEQQPLWNDDDVPAENSDAFVSRIHRHFGEHDAKDETFQLKDDQISNWSEPPNPECHASFGDYGVTATVNAYGDLMQFSSFLGAGQSGVFSADHSNIDEPFYVRSRAEQLLEMQRDQLRESDGYGLRFPSINPQRCRNLGYVHDRWPRYEMEHDKVKLTLQWMVHERTVLQQCLITNDRADDVEVPFRFAKAMHIRDLDYLEWPDPEKQPGQFQMQAPNGYGWVFVQKLQHEGADREKKNEAESTPMPSVAAQIDTAGEDQKEVPKHAGLPSLELLDAVAVVVSVFVDGKAVHWGHSDTTVTGLWTRSLGSKATVEVVAAYKMVHLAKANAAWDEFLIPAVRADVGKYLKSVQFTAFHISKYIKPAEDKKTEQPEKSRIRWVQSVSSTKDTQPHRLPTNSSTDHIDFVVRRNLEHILSVCAIPVENPSVEGGTVAFALTCGDMSMHRVCSSASFFAFSFLSEIAERLDDIEHAGAEHAYKSLRRRIDLVCRGHLQWLSKASLTEAGVFAANYWPTAKVMVDADDGSFLPSDSFTDTPFHLLKISAFMNTHNSNDYRRLARRVIHKVAKAWLHTLDKSDKRASHVWPHAQDEGYNKYRLNEHVWIWRALKTIEDYRRRSSETKDHPDDGEIDREEVAEGDTEDQKVLGIGQRDQHVSDDEKIFRKFDSDVIQRDILRRFTVENDVSKKRMLAMTRSPRETRFLLHASDTALFYGIKWNFFLQTIFDEVWDNTIEAQVHHSENSETGWDNSIRYALAIMMGTRNMTLNKRSPNDLVKTAFDVLLRSTNPNGLFYGQLDGTTKEPALFAREEDRDFYFLASFEIPYVLLTHLPKINSAYKDITGKDPESPVRLERLQLTPQHPFNEVADMITQQPKRQEHRSPTNQASAADAGESQNVSAGHYLNVKSKRPKTTAMKKSVPFNSFIDQSSIIDLDDEWLYNYPSFLGGDEKTAESLHEEMREFLGPTWQNNTSTRMNNTNIVITKAAEKYMQRLSEPKKDDASPTSDSTFFPNDDDNEMYSYVVNVRKQKNLSKQERANGNDVHWVSGSLSLWGYLSRPRVVKEAKKRLIWLPAASDQHALVCYMTSPPDERQAISLFFDRHYHYEKQFLEEITMVLNTWHSELHLSFHRLVNESYELETGIPPSSRKNIPGVANRKLMQCSMGFRFSGDFFDRYWTCYMIEHTSHLWRLGPWGEQGWQQRKVLELQLFDRILKEIVQSTKDIFDMVVHELGENRGTISFSTLSSVEYFSSSVQWQNCQQILQVVEEELGDVLSTVLKWEAREKDRGQERPRWTRNDERKYRGLIGKMQGSTGRRTRDLHNYRNSIRSLKEQLISNQQQSRDNLSLIDAENVRLFTYVTVIFLPLGFAASIFSMSDTPPGDVLKPMIVCSVIALFLTIVALANAKKVSMAINNYSQAKMNSSLFNLRNEVQASPTRHQHEEAKAGGVSEKDKKPGGPSSTQPIINKASFSGHVRFWIVYLFIDLPSEKVSTACGILGDTEPKHWTTYIHVIVGFMVLPVLLVARLIQIFLYNAIDSGRLAWGQYKLFVTSAKPKKQDLKRNWLTDTTRIQRPLKEKVAEVTKRLSDRQISKNEPSRYGDTGMKESR